MSILILDTPSVVVFPGQELEPVRGNIRWAWTSTDPVTMVVLFQLPETEDTRWVVSRDLFVDCLKNEPGPRFGVEDFIVSRGEVSGLIEVQGVADVDGSEFRWSANITFPFYTLGQMIVRSLTEVPRGEHESEIIAPYVDELLERIFSDSTDSG